MISSALRAALLDDTVRPILFVEIDWETGPTRVHSGLGKIMLNGEMFIGVGDIGNISVIRQQSGSTPDRLNLTLSSFDDSVRGEALRANYVGRGVKIWLSVMGSSGNIAASDLIWRGKITDGGVTVGVDNKITLTASNRLEDWSKSRPDRYTDESHQRNYPGDRFFIYVPLLTNYPIYWGAAKDSIPLRDLIN